MTRPRETERDDAPFEGGGLRQLAAAGAVGPHRARVWLRSPYSGRHRLVIRALGAVESVATVDLVVDEAADRTGATTVGDTIDALTPNTNYSVDVLVPGRDALLAPVSYTHLTLPTKRIV